MLREARGGYGGSDLVDENEVLVGQLDHAVTGCPLRKRQQLSQAPSREFSRETTRARFDARSTLCRAASRSASTIQSSGSSIPAEREHCALTVPEEALGSRPPDG